MRAIARAMKVNRLGHPDDVRGVSHFQIEIDAPLKHGTLLDVDTRADTLSPDTGVDSVRNSLHSDVRIHAISGTTSMDT